MTPIEKAAQAFVNQFLKDVGYHEKATNAQLDDKTANSGSNNWNKFAAFIDSLRDRGLNFYNGRKNIGPAGEWCDISYDTEMIWFLMSLGLDAIEAAKLAMKMLYQPSDSCGAGCKYSADYYRAAGAWIDRSGTPKTGDQFFIGKKNDETHTGAVAKVDATYIYTVEGNYGNQVSERKIRRDDSSIAGYGRPNFALVADKFYDDNTPIKDDEDTLSPEEAAAVERIVNRMLDEALGPFIKTFDQLPAWGQREMRLILDCGAIDGGTPADKDPDDIGMRLQLIRVLIGSKRFTFYELGQAFKGEEQADE